MKMPKDPKVIYKYLKQYKEVLEEKLIMHPADPYLLDALDSVKKGLEILEKGGVNGK